MNTREQLHAFQRNQITILLANGAKVVVPAMNVLGAILNVLTPDQRRKVFEQCVESGHAPLILGHAITIPAILPKGYSNGHDTP